MPDDNAKPQAEHNPFDKRGVVSCDEESWMQDRIRTAMRMAIAVHDSQRVHADERQFEDALDGIANGTAVEIVKTLGLETEGTNLDLRVNGDAHLLWEGDD